MNGKLDLTAADLRAVYGQDFSSFIERSFYELNPNTEFLRNWHNEKIAEVLSRCARGEIKRLVIALPPRSLKSHSASVAFPAFLLGHNPNAKIINVSYGQDLANKHAHDCRTLMT